MESPPPSLPAGGEQNTSMYVNSGFDTASDDDCAAVDAYSVAEMLEDLQRKIEASEARLATWKDARDAAERDVLDARQV